MYQFGSRANEVGRLLGMSPRFLPCPRPTKEPPAGLKHLVPRMVLAEDCVDTEFSQPPLFRLFASLNDSEHSRHAAEPGHEVRQGSVKRRHLQNHERRP